MATPVESTTPGKDPKGFSGVDESQLEKSIIRRGLATVAEVEACKSKRTQMNTAQKDGSKNLLDIMVEAKVLTRSQMVRLLQEAGTDTSKKFQIPGYQVISKIGKGSMGVVYKAKQMSVDRVVAIRDGRTSSEFLRNVSYKQEHDDLVAAGILPDLKASKTHTEWLVLDRVGRLQIPIEFLKELDIKTPSRLLGSMEPDGTIKLSKESELPDNVSSIIDGNV